MAKGNKPNPLLAKYEARLMTEYKARLEISTELGLIAAMHTAHTVLGVGPGRAEAFQNGYVEAMNGLAHMLVSDGNDDPDLWYTKDQLEKSLRSILGDANFEKHRHLYKLLLG